MMTKPPPWDASADVWTKWVIDHLRAVDLERGKQALAKMDEDDEQGSLDDHIAIAEELGDIKPLREFTPDARLDTAAGARVEIYCRKFLAFAEAPTRSTLS